MKTPYELIETLYEAFEQEYTYKSIARGFLFDNMVDIFLNKTNIDKSLSIRFPLHLEPLIEDTVKDIREHPIWQENPMYDPFYDFMCDRKVIKKLKNPYEYNRVKRLPHRIHKYLPPVIIFKNCLSGRGILEAFSKYKDEALYVGIEPSKVCKVLLLNLYYHKIPGKGLFNRGGLLNPDKNTHDWGWLNTSLLHKGTVEIQRIPKYERRS